MWAVACAGWRRRCRATGKTGNPALKISDNHRYLVDADGKPFFYLADTAWELFHRLKREEASEYLKDRAAKHFNVIQAWFLPNSTG